MANNNLTLHVEQGQVDVPHLGITLRRILAVAAEGHKATRKRTWSITYKNVEIGKVRVKTNMEDRDEKPVSHTEPA